MSNLACAEELVYDELKQRILDGRLAPGSRLVQRRIAKEFGISSIPVVLALRMLERDRLVTNTPGLGASVRSWTRKEIIDLYEMRASLEGLASRLCAERATPTDLEVITATCENFRSAIDGGDAEANVQADVEFHTAIVNGAHSLDLAWIVENLSIMQCSIRIFGITVNKPELLSLDRRSVHDEILEAIVHGRADVAERVAKEHLRLAKDRSMPWIEQTARNMDSGRTTWSRWWASKTSAQPDAMISEVNPEEPLDIRYA